MYTAKVNLVTNASMATTVATPSQTIFNAWGYAVQAVWTGAGASGDIQLQATIDDVTWSNITGTDEAVSGSGSFIWNVTTACYDQFRVLFTPSLGGSSGSLTVNIMTKGY